VRLGIRPDGKAVLLEDGLGHYGRGTLPVGAGYVDDRRYLDAFHKNTYAVETRLHSLS